MRHIFRRAALTTAGTFCAVTMMASPALASSGSMDSSTGNARGSFEDNGDIVTACDLVPNNGRGATVTIEVQQANGAYASKPPVTVWNGGCASVHQDVAREAATVLLTVCDIMPNRVSYCTQRWLYNDWP